MTGLVLVGTALVVLTWLIWLALVVALGRWTAVFVARTAPLDKVWRASLWWGFAWLTLVVLGASLLLSMGSSQAALIISSLSVLFGVGSLIFRRAEIPRWAKPQPPVLALLVAIGLATLYLAFKVLGPISNYDSGLYHLGSVKYAYDFAAIPGIASLYFPFGYASAQFPMAALLGNGPWEGSGYRLLNGAVVLLVVADIFSRLLNRRWTWGTCTLVFGVSAAFIPLVAMADGIVTSPTADTTVLILTLMSAVYLADFIEKRSTASSLDLSTALVLSMVAVAYRPTMIIFALSTLLVGAYLIAHRRLHTSALVAPLGNVLAVTSLLAIVVLLRDRLLSGWVAYPLSLFQFNVDWAAPDPTHWRDATLAAARDPGSNDGFVTAHSFNWVVSWIERLPQQWEFWFFMIGFIVLVAAAVLMKARNVSRPPLIELLTALIPSSVAVIAWFVFSPPSFRFIWGPLFLLLFLPLGWILNQFARQGLETQGLMRLSLGTLIACSLAVASVTAYSLAFRNQITTITQEETWKLGSLRVPYAVTPIDKPEVIAVETPGGLTVFTPSSGNEQCWDNYPLCTFYTGQSLSQRGAQLGDGFIVN